MTLDFPDNISTIAHSPQPPTDLGQGRLSLSPYFSTPSLLGSTSNVMMSEVVPMQQSPSAAPLVSDVHNETDTANDNPQPPPPSPLPAHLPPSTESNSRDSGYPGEIATSAIIEMHDPNTSMTVEGFEEGEGELAMAERTLVGEGGSGEGTEESKSNLEKRNGPEHVRGPSSSSLSLPTKEEGYAYRKSLDASANSHGRAPNTANSMTTPATWDPLKNQPETEEEKMDLKDKTVIVEEGDVVDSTGKLLYPDLEPSSESVDQKGDLDRKPPSNLATRRTSHLRLDLKPPSPLPWEHISPPLDNNLKEIAGYYTPVTSHKFRTLQSAGGPRPLIPKSSYYFGPPPADSAYGTPPVGQIGVHHPREVLRVERDYTGGELIQFAPIYPLELEGRITPTHFLESINAINELLISAHSLRHSLLDNALAIFSLQISKLFVKSHFEKEMQRLRTLIAELNTEVYNPVGLNMLWPRSVAFLYLEIEYY